jgi:hypothetical protein
VKCEDIRERLTAYLDGDLEGTPATIVRGHLRECEACRKVSVDEAALRDGLRALPTLDPPASMWAGVQARLAAAEVAESKRPAWKRAFAKLRENWKIAVAGGAVVAFASVAIYMRLQRSAPVEIAKEAPTPVEVHPVTPPAPSQDVTADIADEPKRNASTYETAARDAIALAEADKPNWTETKRAVFDERLAGLLAQAASKATDPRAQQRSWRTIIRFAQQAVARDAIAMVDP